MRYTFFLLIACSFWCKVNSQRIELSNNWTYSFNSRGSEETVSKPSEKEMPFVEKDTMLRKTGLVYFKRTVVIPSSLKQYLDTTGVPALYLGRIMQADETFFNGKSIGKTTSSDVQRVYTIPFNACSLC